MTKVEPMNVAKFERFFRAAAGLDVDKSDLRRYNDFVAQKTYDLLIRGRAVAKANGPTSSSLSTCLLRKGSRRVFTFLTRSTRRVSSCPSSITSPGCPNSTWPTAMIRKQSFRGSWVDLVSRLPVLSKSSIPSSRTHKPCIGNAHSASLSFCCRINLPPLFRTQPSNFIMRTN